MDRRIVIEGNDGTGKSTLVRSLRLLGFTNVHDRAEMSAATLDSSVQPASDTTYILLVCHWEVSRSRLAFAGRDMTEKWHTDSALQHYDTEFRRIAPDFDATVFQSISPTHTLIQALEVLGSPIRVGVASGRLADKGAQDLGFPFVKTGDQDDPIYRQLLNAAQDRQLVRTYGPLTVIQTRGKTYPQMVALGALDVAVVGSDVLEGNPYASQVEVVERIPQVSPATGKPVTVSTAGTMIRRGGSDRLLRVATPFPEWAQKVYGERGIPHTTFHVSGGTEAMVAAGLADVIFDIVETGKTLRANGLHIIEEIGTLDTCVIRRKT